MRAKVRTVDRNDSPAMWRRRIVILFAVLMLCATTALGMGQSALAAPADGDQPSDASTSDVAPTAVEPGDGEVTEEPTPEDTVGATLPAEEIPTGEATPPTLVNPEGIAAQQELAGPLVAVEPYAASGQATIRIDAAVIRGASTGLAGFTYTLHEVVGSGTSNNPYRPGNASAFSCTVPSNSTSCTITVTGVSGQGGNNKSWFIVQTPNSMTYDVPQYRLNDFSNPKDIFHYVGRTVALQSTRDYVVPGTTSNTALADRSGNSTRASSVVAPLKNPGIAPTCQPGLKVAIQMDVSSSTAGYRTDYRQALHGLVDGLVGTGTQISLFTFGNVSPVRVGNSNWESPAPRNVDTQANAIKSSITTYTGNPGTQRTNWDAGFRRLESAHTQYDYDLIIFITDGAPNVVWDDSTSGYSSPNSNNVTVRSIDEAVLSANALKNAGVRTVTVGVGDGVTGDVYRNLQAISGPTSGSDYYVGGWVELQGYIKNIVDAANCSLPITVSKTTVDKSGTEREDVGGWKFNAVKSTGSDSAVQLVGDPSRTTGAGINGRALWNLTFTQPANQSAGVTLTEETLPPGWAFSGAECTVDGQAVETMLDGVNRSVTLSGLTAVSGPVHCTFTNTETPPKAALTLKKIVQNENGGTGQVSDWTLTAVGQTNGVSGKTGDSEVTARVVEPGTYVLSESGTVSGYEASPWTCVNNENGQAVAVTDSSVALASGDDMTCSITNSDRPGTATWTKVEGDGTTLLAGSTWTIEGPGHEDGTEIVDCESGSCSGLDKDSAGGRFRLEGLAWGHYTVTETEAPAGYQLGDPAPTFEFDVSGDSLAFSKREAVVNNRILGTATWSKVAEGSEELLSGSEWELTGPDDAIAIITDNTGDPSYTGLDRDPAPGKFKLEELSWGDYELVETMAPAGYQILQDPIPFTVGPDEPAQLNWDLGSIDNKQRDGVALPLTGGRSTDAIVIGGGLLLLAAAAAGLIQRRRKA